MNLDYKVKIFGHVTMYSYVKNCYSRLKLQGFMEMTKLNVSNVKDAEMFFFRYIFIRKLIEMDV